MKRIWPALLPLLLLGLACERKAGRGYSDEQHYLVGVHTRIENAFFGDSAARDLRLLRNEIYARHGRPFTSPYLVAHFSAQPWYCRRTDYSDSMLTFSELQIVGRIASLEKRLANLRGEALNVYRGEVAFRGAEAESTIVRELDYTGDGRPEMHITRVGRSGDSVVVTNIVIEKTDTLFAESRRASFAPSVFDMEELSTNYQLALELAPTGEPRKLDLDVPEYVKTLWVKQLSRARGSDSTAVVGQVMDYIDSFDGYAYHSITDESGGCALFWYAPARTFLEYYCP